MKAITIKQPWVSLIVHGIKDIENRTWACPKKYIGQRVLIHASAKPILKGSCISHYLTEEQYKSVAFATPPEKQLDICFLEHYSPAIIGSIEIVDCIINHPSVWAEKTEVKADENGLPYYGDKSYSWVLANPVLYENYIPAKGKLSFWNYPGIQEVKIECPECGSIEIAVEDHTTEPFSTYLHSCNNCGYVIMESEWNVIKEEGK